MKIVELLNDPILTETWWVVWSEIQWLMWVLFTVAWPYNCRDAVPFASPLCKIIFMVWVLILRALFPSNLGPHPTGIQGGFDKFLLSFLETTGLGFWCRGSSLKQVTHGSQGEYVCHWKKLRISTALHLRNIPSQGCCKWCRIFWQLSLRSCTAGTSAKRYLGCNISCVVRLTFCCAYHSRVIFKLFIAWHSTPAQNMYHDNIVGNSLCHPVAISAE